MERRGKSKRDHKAIEIDENIQDFKWESITG